MICVDGGSGLIAAMPISNDKIPRPALLRPALGAMPSTISTSF
jgi:hypothetical protein